MNIITEVYTETYPLIPIYPNTIHVPPPPIFIPSPVFHPTYPIYPTYPTTQPTAYTPNSNTKTIWIVSCSEPRLKNPLRDHAAHSAMQACSPVNIPPSYILHCQNWPMPPPELCAQVSGVSRRMRDWVKGSGDVVRKDVHNAVQLILGAWGKGDDDVVFHTASVAGTHRSVAAAEMIAERLRKKMERCGVANFDIVVKHPHRQRQAMDPH